MLGVVPAVSVRYPRWKYDITRIVCPAWYTVSGLIMVDGRGRFQERTAEASNYFTLVAPYRVTEQPQFPLMTPQTITLV